VKTSAIVPMRHTSERVPGKNYRLLGGRPLYHRIVATLLSVDAVDEVVIDTDSPTIRADVADTFPSVRVLERPEHLRAGETPMNEVLLNTLDSLDADLVVQTHATNPFLRPRTVAAALQRLQGAAGSYDSLFSVSRIQARLWSAAGEPLNHDPAVLLRTQDLAPVFLENSCLYVFPPQVLRALRNRIGARPLMFEIPMAEALDIDEEHDFRLAEAVAGMAVGGQ
jgi:CMP-N-acetylneuraminic acid synthetase